MICVFKAVFQCACYCNKKILTMVLEINQEEDTMYLIIILCQNL